MPGRSAKSGLTLAIEISNPSSGPRGVWRTKVDDLELETLAGPGVALGRYDEDAEIELLDAELLREGTRHDDDLMPAIDRLFARVGASPADLARVAVSIGPGGYTSLRIAVATAKMLAEATGARTIPVPSASVADWCGSGNLEPAIVCLASKGAATYGVLRPPSQAVGAGWWTPDVRSAVESVAGSAAAAEIDRHLRAGSRPGSAPLGMITAEHVRSLRPASLIADRFLPAPIRAVAEGLAIVVFEPVFSAESLLYLSGSAPPVDPLALSPLYGREAEAVTQWRLRKG